MTSSRLWRSLIRQAQFSLVLLHTKDTSQTTSQTIKDTAHLYANRLE